MENFNEGYIVSTQPNCQASSFYVCFLNYFCFVCFNQLSIGAKGNFSFTFSLHGTDTSLVVIMHLYMPVDWSTVKILTAVIVVMQQNINTGDGRTQWDVGEVDWTGGGELSHSDSPLYVLASVFLIVNNVSSGGAIVNT